MSMMRDRPLLLTIICLCLVYWYHRLNQATWHTDSDGLKSTDSTINPSTHSFHSSQSESPLSRQYPAVFPRYIWQTSSKAGKIRYADEMQTWRNLKNFEHHWLSDADADDFVHQSFSMSRPSLVTFWDDLSRNIRHSTDDTAFDSTASVSIVLRADLLRYMLMYIRGGVYADIDTSVLRHVDQWVPVEQGSFVISAIIGIEYDDNTFPMFIRPLSFCQWTMMSKPGHPIFERAINRVVSNLQFLARREEIASLSELQLEKMDVLEATGPGMISDVVLEVIQDSLPDQHISWSTFHNLKEARLYGDVLILPINAFGINQSHSHSADPAYGPALVTHHFARSWYRPEQTTDQNKQF